MHLPRANPDVGARPPFAHFQPVAGQRWRLYRARGVEGQLFMSLYKVTGSRAGSYLPRTGPDRRACANGCHDEGRDGAQAIVWSWLDVL